MRAEVVKTLKLARSSQPFNFAATSLAYAYQQITGQHSEKIIKHLHRVGEVKRTLPNDRKLALWSKGDDWVSNQIFWRGWDGYEPETVQLFFRLAQRARITLDVGAYVGYYTLLAAHANPAAQVFAFEPLPTVFKRLQQNIQLNQLTNVTCINSAVSDIDGTAEFFHAPNELPTSSSLSFEFMRATNDLMRTKVPVIALDKFVREQKIARVDLVKIDTESTEPDVLSGMRETLQKDHPFIVCEVLKGRGSEKALSEILQPLNYRYYLLTPDGRILKDQIEGHPEWLNYLFTTLSPKEFAEL